MTDAARGRDELARLLDGVESEMRRIGFWHEAPPDLLADYDAGRRRTYLDAPSFELWLQAVFLPRARAAVATGDLPAHSSVGTMALRQWDYHEHVAEAQPVLRLLHQFDEAVERRGGRQEGDRNG